jgi:excisionase family DNA binding protein
VTYLVVVLTDPGGVPLLRRHRRYSVRFAAPNGTDVQTSADVHTASDCGPVQRLALKVPEAAQAIGLSERKLRDLIASGEVAAFHVDRSIRVRVSDLERYLAQLVEREAPGRWRSRASHRSCTPPWTEGSTVRR